MLSFQSLYDLFETREHLAREESLANAGDPNLSPLERHLLGRRRGTAQVSDGFARMNKCRAALNAIDNTGEWTRSFHQREFHELFLQACARIFWKTDPPGAFARNHQAILENNGWDHLVQEILVSTPRRFGKTMAVSMFAAAMMYSCPQLELSIYSTCKRISQKLLRNVQMFLTKIYEQMRVPPLKVLRSNMEELVIIGNEGVWDERKVNSYPSKVRFARFRHFFVSFLFSFCRAISRLVI